MCYREEPSQFSVGQTARSLTCSIMEKPHTGVDECPRIILLCFRARISDQNQTMSVVPFVIQKHSLPLPGPRANHVAVIWNESTIIWGGFGDDIKTSTIDYHLSGKVIVELSQLK